MSNRRVYLASGDLPPRPSAWREAMMFIAGYLVAMFAIATMQLAFKVLPGTTVCTKYLWYENVPAPVVSRHY